MREQKGRNHVGCMKTVQIRERILKRVAKRRNPGKSPEKGLNSSKPKKKADIERESKRGPKS